VVILMGSGAGAAEEAVDALRKSGEKVGLLKVRLYRPFAGVGVPQRDSCQHEAIAVLDRTKRSRAAWASRSTGCADDIRGAIRDEAWRGHPANHRRALWIVVEGVHTLDGEGGV